LAGKFITFQIYTEIEFGQRGTFYQPKISKKRTEAAHCCPYDRECWRWKAPIL